MVRPLFTMIPCAQGRIERRREGQEIGRGYATSPAY
jgi:hypothetical protein